MLIDCDECAMQHTSTCDECVVTMLLAGGDGVVELGTGEPEALRNLSDAGLVAPLRLVSRTPPPEAASG